MENDRFIGEGDRRHWHWSCEESQEVVPVVRWSRYGCLVQEPVLKINNNMSSICITLIYIFRSLLIEEIPIFLLIVKIFSGICKEKCVPLGKLINKYTYSVLVMVNLCLENNLLIIDTRQQPFYSIYLHPPSVVPSISYEHWL